MPKFVIEHQSLKADYELMIWMDCNLQKVISEKARFEKIATSTDSVAKTISFSGKMVSGLVCVNNGKIIMEINIPLLYRPFIPAIKTVISNVLKEL